MPAISNLPQNPSQFNNTDIPDEVLLNMVRTGVIPLIKVKWMDERIGCRRARRDDPRQAEGCQMLACDSDGATWCRLNAPGATVCVFDEPENAEIWDKIRDQQRVEAEIEAERTEHDA